jgi:hypothetical protein
MSQKYPGGFITKSPVAPTQGVASGMWTLDQAMQLNKQSLWPATPGTPTIGTATAVTFSTATVTFTAPSNLGSGAVTFTATSNPAGGTGTGTSPITVSGLSELTSYTFTVTASTPGGTSPASAASNSITTPANVPTVIGQAFGGGFYAGQIGVSGVATHYIIVGPLASAENASLQWKTTNTSTAGTSSDIDGPTNSSNMNNASHPAAQFCEGLTIGGYTNWYLPAKNELEVCYYNLKPTTTANNTNPPASQRGANPNSVPARPSGYTSGNPAQTSATIFKDTGSEYFTAAGYWTSTQYSDTAGLRQLFNIGSQYYDGKNATNRVRAIRRVAV